MTPQRLAILEVLHDGGHLSPIQVSERARQRLAGVTEATVYRTLDFLAQQDVIFSTNTGSGHLVYELSQTDHHHLVCRRCGARMDLANELFEDFILELEHKTRFRLNAGHLTFFGLCPACQDNE